MLLVQYMSPPTNLLVVDVVVFKHNIKRIVHLINPSAVTARCTLQIKLYIGMYQLVLLNHHKKGRWGPTVTQTYMRSLFSMAEGRSSQGAVLLLRDQIYQSAAQSLSPLKHIIWGRQ